MSSRSSRSQVRSCFMSCLDSELLGLRGTLCCIDWDDSKTHLADLKGTAPGAAKSAGDKLWEDNWDDDDIEDDFSVQLRYARVHSSRLSSLSLTMCALPSSRFAETS